MWGYSGFWSLAEPLLLPTRSIDTAWSGYIAGNPGTPLHEKHTLRQRTTIYEPLTRNESISLLTALTSRSVDSDSNLEGPESEPQLNQGASCPPARLPRPLSLQQAWQVFVREGTSSTGGQLLKPRTPRAPLKLQSLTNKFQNLLSHD